MHQNCNNDKAGQINNYPVFNCNCHYLYFNVKENTPEVFYKNTISQWESIPLLEDLNIFNNSVMPNEKLSSTCTIMPRERNGKIGYSKLQGCDFGHMLPSIPFSRRNECHMENFYSLMRCNRLEAAKKETGLINLKISNEEKMDIYFTFGRYYGEYKKHKEAIKEYYKIIKLNNKEKYVYNNLGYTKYLLGRHEEAITDYDEAIKLNLQDAKIYTNRGFANIALGKHKEAIEDYDKAIELDPQDTIAYYSRGIANAALNKYKEAIKDSDKAIEFNPQFAEAYFDRALSRNKLGKHQEAIKDFHEAKRLYEEKSDTVTARICETEIVCINKLTSDIIRVET